MGCRAGLIWRNRLVCCSKKRGSKARQSDCQYTASVMSQTGGKVSHSCFTTIRFESRPILQCRYTQLGLLGSRVPSQLDLRSPQNNAPFHKTCIKAFLFLTIKSGKPCRNILTTYVIFQHIFHHT
jgi:hypothetical protein